MNDNMYKKFHFDKNTKAKIKKYCLIIVFVYIIMMVIEWIQRKKEHGLQMDNVPWYFRYPIYIGVSVLIICFFSQPVTFIYFQF